MELSDDNCQIPINIKEYFTIAVDFLIEPPTKGLYTVCIHWLGSEFINWDNFVYSSNINWESPADCLQWTQNLNYLELPLQFLMSQQKMVLFTIFRIIVTGDHMSLVNEGFSILPAVWQNGMAISGNFQ